MCLWCNKEVKNKRLAAITVTTVKNALIRRLVRIECIDGGLTVANKGVLDKSLCNLALRGQSQLTLT